MNDPTDETDRRVECLLHVRTDPVLLASIAYGLLAIVERDAARRERERCAKLTYEAEGDRLRDMMADGRIPTAWRPTMSERYDRACDGSGRGPGVSSGALTWCPVHGVGVDVTVTGLCRAEIGGRTEQGFPRRCELRATGPGADAAVRALREEECIRRVCGSVDDVLTEREKLRELLQPLIRRAEAAERERDELRAEVERLKAGRCGLADAPLLAENGEVKVDG